MEGQPKRLPETNMHVVDGCSLAVLIVVRRLVPHLVIVDARSACHTIPVNSDAVQVGFPLSVRWVGIVNVQSIDCWFHWCSKPCSVSGNSRNNISSPNPCKGISAILQISHARGETIGPKHNSHFRIIGISIMKISWRLQSSKS